MNVIPPWASMASENEAGAEAEAEAQARRHIGTAPYTP